MEVKNEESSIATFSIPQSSYTVLQYCARSFYPKRDTKVTDREEPTPKMSIEEKSVESGAVTQSPIQAPRQLQKRWYSVLRSPLWLCLLAALLIRVWLVYHTHGVIDGDEAMVGIQAEHILRGEHPYYFYGQPYMG